MRLHEHGIIDPLRRGRFQIGETFITYILVESKSLAEVIREVPVDAVLLDPVPVEVIVEVLVVVGPGPGDAPDVPHEGLVDGPQSLVGQLPASVAEVVEARLVATEVGALLHAAGAAQSILEIGINLDKKHHEANGKITSSFYILVLSC